MYVHTYLRQSLSIYVRTLCASRYSYTAQQKDKMFCGKDKHSTDNGETFRRKERDAPWNSYRNSAVSCTEALRNPSGICTKFLQFGKFVTSTIGQKSIIYICHHFWVNDSSLLISYGWAVVGGNLRWTVGTLMDWLYMICDSFGFLTKAICEPLHKFNWKKRGC